MRKVIFYIDDQEYFKKLFKSENPDLTESEISDILSNIEPFVAVYTLTGNGKIPDRYELSIDGKTVYMNSLNGYQRGVVLNSCDRYFESGCMDLVGVVRVEET